MTLAAAVGELLILNYKGTIAIVYLHQIIDLKRSLLRNLF